MIRRTFPPLSTLVVFEAAARLQSFKLASEELNLTPSAISHQIASLEKNLGVSLFQRLSNCVILNNKGEIYFPIVQRALDHIAFATDSIRKKSDARILTLQMSATLAIRWIIPRLQGFGNVASDISIKFHTSSTDEYFDPDQADIGLIYAQAPDKPKIDYVFLRQEKLVAACSYKVAEKITSLIDVKHAQFLLVAGSENDAVRWVENIGLTDIPRQSGLFFDSNLLAIEAAISGYGMVIVPEFLISGELASGKLIIPIKSKIDQSGCWYLAHLKSRKHDKNIKKILAWITQL